MTKMVHSKARRHDWMSYGIAVLIFMRTCAAFCGPRSRLGLSLAEDSTCRVDMGKVTVKPLLMKGEGFFDKLKEAFENDSDDLEPIVGDESESYIYESRQRTEKTDVQKRFLQAQAAVGSRSKVKGAAPISEQSLVNTKWTIDFYLAGIPDRDPTNNLYGDKVNISSRDSQLSIGTSIPAEPSISVPITLLADGICRTEKSDFTSGNDGQWRIAENGNQIRLGIDTTGFQRTLQTTGTLSKVFWSESDEVTTQASSTYSIPSGMLYCDTTVGYGSTPGTFVMNDGLLQVEQTQGLFGISTKMVACGKFSASMEM